MVDVWSNLNVITALAYNASAPQAWRSGVQCSNCDSRHHAVVARVDTASQILWLRCVACYTGHVMVDGALHPAAPTLETPTNLPTDEARVWEDIRGCLGIHAWNAAVLLCRKLLLHAAVSAGLPAKSANGRAPTFVDATTYLETEGYITQKMRPWVDRIKDVGNEATHEIPAIDEAQAMDVARFTQQLLRLVYELTAMADPDQQPE